MHVHKATKNPTALSSVSVHYQLYISDVVKAKASTLKAWTFGANASAEITGKIYSTPDRTGNEINFDCLLLLRFFFYY